MLKKLIEVDTLEKTTHLRLCALQREIENLAIDIRENMCLQNLKALTEEAQTIIQYNKLLMHELKEEIRDVHRLSSTVRCAMQQARSLFPKDE